MTALGIMFGVLIGTGVLLIVAGLQPAPPPTPKPDSKAFAGLRRSMELTQAERTRALAGAGIGLVLAVFTGWVILILIVPAAMVAIPRLLSPPDEKNKIDQLQALQDWTRSLSGVLVGGGNRLTDALVATLPSAPDPIRPQTENLVARLQARQPAGTALRQWANEIDSETGDLIASALIMGAKETGSKLSRILETLAESVQDQVKARRATEAERNSPRSQARMMSAIFAIALAGFVFLTSFGTYYRSPGGQMLLAIIVAAFVATMWWMRQAATTPDPPRFLPASHAPGAQEARS